MQKAEHSLIKGLGILVGDKMTTGNDGKLGIGNGFRNKSGMRIFYHIIIAGKDKGGTLNLCELRRLHVWIVDHQSEHLGIQSCLGTSLCEQPRYSVAYLYRNLYLSLYARSIKVCSVENQFLHTLRMRKGKYHCYVTAIRKAEYMGFRYGVLIHECKQVLCKLSYGERCISTRCLSVSASVNRNNTEVLGERLYLVLEIAAILPIPMKQNQGEAFSFLYIVVGDIH